MDVRIPVPIDDPERADVVLARLKGVRRIGTGWTAPCPAHEDHRPSLSIAVGDDQRILLRCHRGCRTEDVVAALGLTMADLQPPRPSASGRSQVVATYEYTDEHGKVLFEVVRLAPKDFRQRRPDGKGGHIWKLEGVPRVLYRLPAVIQAAAQGATIYIAEGEKDVEALEKAGVVATCNPGGAGKWHDDFSAFLAGADVVIVADKDAVGRDHAHGVARSVADFAESVRVVEAKVGKDAADHLAAGKRLDELVPVPDDSAEEQADSEDAAKTFWLSPRSAADWAAYVPERLDYVIEPWAARGYVTDIVGREKGGKSTFVAMACGAVAAGTPFLGYRVELAPVLYLYEGAPPAWRYLLKDADLLDCGGLYAHLWPLLPPAIRDLRWPQLCEWIAELVGKLHIALVAIDILPCWARLGPEEENDSGIARQITDQLRLIATNYETAIWNVRHTRKGLEEDHLEASRGTGAWIGAADISLGYRTPTDTKERAAHPTRRILSAVGRAALPSELVIDFDRDSHSFTVVGEQATSTRRLSLRDWLVEHTPATLERAIVDGWSRTSIRERAGGAGYVVKHVTAALDSLVSEGLLHEGKPVGASGRPAAYYYRTQAEELL